MGVKDQNRRRAPNFLAFTLYEQMMKERDEERARELLENSTRGSKESEPFLPKMRRRSLKNSNHRILRVIWFTICSIGLLIHGWFTTTDYLKYKTTTEVKVFIPTEFRPPAVSLCLMFHDSINVSKLTIEEQKSWKQNACYEDSMEDECLDILKKYDMETIMKNLTYGLINHHDDHAKKYDQIIYYKKGMKCIRYTVKNSSESIHVGDVDEMYPTYNTFISMSLPNHFKNINDSDLKVAIFFHDSKTLAHIREGNLVWISMDIEGINYHQTTYDHVESHNLEAPFRTKCSKYLKTKYKSRGQCMEYCYQKQYKKFHGLDSGLITTTSFTAATLPSKRHLVYDRSIDTACYATCPEKCESLSYFVVTVGDYNIPQIDSIFFHEVTLSRPFTNVSFMASFDLRSFIIFMASASGLWFGCSLYVSITQVMNFVMSFSLKDYL